MVWKFIEDCCKYGLYDIEETGDNSFYSFCEFSLSNFPDKIINSSFQPKGEYIIKNQSFKFSNLTDENYWLRLESDGLVRRTMSTYSHKAKDDILHSDRELNVITLDKKNIGLGSLEDYGLIGDYAIKRFPHIAKEMLPKILTSVDRQGDDREWRSTEIENRNKILLWDQRQRQISEVFFNMFYRTLRARDDFSKDKVDSLARQVFPGLKRYEKLDLLEIFKDYIPKGSEVRWIDF